MSSQLQTDHIPDSRLRITAKDVTTFFTGHEFNHVQICRDCFDLWKQYLEEDAPNAEVAAVRRDSISNQGDNP